MPVAPSATSTSSSSSSSRMHGTQQQHHKQAPAGVFYGLLSDYGFQFSSSAHTQHVLTAPARLRLFLENHLPMHSSQTQEFFSQLQTHCSDGREMRKMLLPTTPPADLYASNHPHQSYCLPLEAQQSVMRVLLSVSSLQSQLITWLLESVAVEGEKWLEEEGLASLAVAAAQDNYISLPSTCLPRLVLNQLRWLDVVYDGAHLCEKLLDALEACPPVLQREMISALPEIVDDLQHNTIASPLISMLQHHDTEHHLTLPILDALGQLHLSSEHSSAVVDKVKHMIKAATLKQLPILLKFLLKSSNKENVQDIIAVLRRDLSFLTLSAAASPSPSSLSLSRSRPNSGKQDKHNYDKEEIEENDTATHPVLIVSVLKTAFQFSPLLCKAYLDTLSTLTSCVQFTFVDILLCAILHAIPQQQKHTQTAFKKKVAQDCIALSVLTAALQQHAVCMNPLFESLTKLAEFLIRQHEARIRSLGATMQQLLFTYYPTITQRRMLLDHLLQSIGSKKTEEMNTSLLTLQTLAYQHTQEMKVFYAFIKSMQQYMEEYSVIQVRWLFQTFAVLCVEHQVMMRGGDGVVGELGDDTDAVDVEVRIDPSLMVFIRKNLSLDVCHQRIGIIGAVAIIEQVANPRLDSPSSSSSSRLSPSIQQELHKLFELLNSCSSHHTAYLAFLYDELALSIKAGRCTHRDVLAMIESYYTNTAASLLKIDLPASDPRRSSSTELTHWQPADLTADVLYGLDTEIELAIPIVHMLAQSADVQKSIQDQLWLFAPMLQLLVAKERQLNGVLKEIDGLLAAPLCLSTTAQVHHIVVLSPETSSKSQADDDRDHSQQPAAHPDISSSSSDEIDHAALLSAFRDKSSATQLLIISCLFHSINWCRELLNAWCGLIVTELLSTPQDYADNVDKLISRLELLICLENELQLYVNSLHTFEPSQLLGMAETTQPQMIQEIQRMELGCSITGDHDSQKYTQLGSKTNKVHAIRLAKKKAAMNKQNKRNKSHDSSSSGDDDRSDSDVEDRRKKQNKKKKKQQQEKKQDTGSHKKAEEEVKHYQNGIGPFFRPLSLSVFQLLAQPPLTKLKQALTAAEQAAQAPSTQERARKRGQGSISQADPQAAPHSKKHKATNEEKQASSVAAAAAASSSSTAVVSAVQSSGAVGLSASPLLSLPLSPLCLHYLLSDLCLKLKSVLPRSAVPIAFFAAIKKTQVSASIKLQLSYTPQSLLNELLPIFLPLHTHFVCLCAYLISDASTASSLAGEHEREVLIDCLLLIIQTVKIIIQCETLKNRKDRPLVLSALTRLAGVPQSKEWPSVCSALFNHLHDCLFAFTTLDHAVAVVSVLHLLLDYPNESGEDGGGESGGKKADKKHESLSRLASRLLSTDWSHQNQKMKPKNIAPLLSLYVYHAPDTVAAIEQLARRMEALGREEEDTGTQADADDASGSQSHSSSTSNSSAGTHRRLFAATLTVKSIPLFVPCLMDALLQDFKSFSLQRCQSESQSQRHSFMHRFLQYADIMGILMEQCKIYGTNNTLLTAACRSGKAFIEKSSKLLPTLQSLSVFSSTHSHQKMQQLMKALQTTTRTLQVILSHGVKHCIVSVVKLAPSVKKQLDGFIFAVKALLKSVGLQDTFTQGQLKNRELDGTEISSQKSSSYSQEENEADEEEEGEEGEQEEAK